MNVPHVSDVSDSSVVIIPNITESASVESSPGPNETEVVRRLKHKTLFLIQPSESIPEQAT